MADLIKSVNKRRIRKGYSPILEKALQLTGKRVQIILKNKFYKIQKSG